MDWTLDRAGPRRIDREALPDFDSPSGLFGSLNDDSTFDMLDENVVGHAAGVHRYREEA